MKITKLQFTNFMGYNSLNLPSDQDEELPDGLILINGRNSHGKSTILEGIIYAFFGPNAFKLKKASKFITYGESIAELYVYFILDSKSYYLYRKWSRSNSSIALKMFRLNSASNNYEEIKNLNIENFFEITEKQALNTVFVKQGQIEELASKKGATVRDMILKLFKLDIIEKTLKYLDKEKSKNEALKEKNRDDLIPISRIEEEINELNSDITINEEILSKKTAEKREKEKKRSQLPSQEILSTLSRLFTKNSTNKEKYESYQNDFIEKIKDTQFVAEDVDIKNKIEKKLNELASSQKELEKKIYELDTLLGKKNSEKGGFRTIIKETKDKIAKMEDSLLFTEKKIAKCPLCQNELYKDHYDDIVKELRYKVKKNTILLQQISSFIEAHQVKIQECRTELDTIKAVKAYVTNISENFVNLNKYKEDFNQSQAILDEYITNQDKLVKTLDLKAITVLSNEVLVLNTELGTIGREINEKTKNISSNKKSIKHKEEEIKQMRELEKKIENIEIELNHITKVREFVRRFVTEYMITKRLIKNISIKAEKYIREFTAGQYGNLMIDLEGTTKTGLAFKVKDHYNGVFESIEMISGGDRTSLGMALRLSISELMKVIRPTKDSPKKYPKIDFLLLDEPLAALDEERRKRILNHLVKSKAFPQVFLITHTTIPPEIKTHRIFVTKNHSTGISSARFERQTQMMEDL